MRVPVIAVLAATAPAGCTAEGMRASAWGGGPADRPAWRGEAPSTPEPAIRRPAPEGLDRA
jgi:hypothetical protein